jgi:hypothetical protein
MITSDRERRKNMQVYLITGRDGFALEYDSTEECKREFCERISEEPWRSEEEFMIFANVEEFDPFNEEPSKMTYIRYGYGENAIFEADEFDSFEEYKAELIAQQVACDKEEIYCKMFTLTAVDAFYGDVTVSIKRL